MPEQEPIGVIGVGWVGLVTAACFAELGHEVYARDILPEKVESLRRGEVPIHEPTLPELVTKNADRLHFTTDMDEVLENASLLFCCVDTPPTYSGDADLSRVDAVIESLGASNEHALVMKSTVPVGTGRSIRRRRDGVAYVSNPEFLKEGSAVADFMKPDRVVVGADDDSQEFAARVEALYAPLDTEVVRTDVASAEMIKLASNAFLATKISFINEIANVSEDLGADVEEVARGMGLDDRIGPKFLKAGVGYGGSCLAGDETVHVREGGRERVVSLGELVGPQSELAGAEHPTGLEVLSLEFTDRPAEFRPVSAITWRWYSGEILEVRTEAGHALRCTPDHPFVIEGIQPPNLDITLARDLDACDALPVVGTGAQHLPHHYGAFRAGPSGALVVAAGVATEWTTVSEIVRLPFEGLVYSLEVPGSETFATTGGLVVHNCFPKDVQALKQLAGNTGYHFQLLTAVIEVNELQKRRTISKLQKHLGSLVGKEIALLGVAFKPDTDDVREATSLVLAGRLQGEGAHVRVYDSVAAERAREILGDAQICESALDAVEGADAVVLVTEWPEFRELDWQGEVKERMRTPLIVDGRNFLDRETLQGAGFTYEGVGR